MAFEWNSILSIASILTTIIVGRILSTKIKAQKDIIEQYKTYLESVDLKKIKEVHELQMKAVLSRVELEMDNHFRATNRQIGIQFDEMATYISDQMEHFGPQGKEAILKNHLPHCRDLFEKKNLEG